jgi:sugar lactone lactonase YvrE
MKVLAAEPEKVLPGGIVRIFVEELESPVGVRVFIGNEEAEILGATPDILSVRVPTGSKDGLMVQSQEKTAEFNLNVGRIVASDLHPVSNPAIDYSGNVFATYSGARGEEVPFGIFKITPDGYKEPFLGDILNPTGLAFGPDQQLYISSRHTGSVYRSTFDKQVEKFAEGLGIASGMAFDSTGNLFVGDRSGTIFKISPDGEKSAFCSLEASVSAYHMAIDKNDHIFVVGPTLATQDVIHRIDADANIEVFFKGLGRPQGIAFDPEGHLIVAGSYRGRKGVYKFTDNEPVLWIASTMMVGLAFANSSSSLFLVDNENLYRINTD